MKPPRILLVSLFTLSLTSCTLFKNGVMVLPDVFYKPLGTIAAYAPAAGITVVPPIIPPTATDTATPTDIPLPSPTSTLEMVVISTNTPFPTIAPTYTAISPTSTPPPSETPMPVVTNTPVPTPTTQQAVNPSSTPKPATAPVSSGSGCAVSSNSSFESQVITLINKERTNHGLNALSANAKLTSAARTHSEDMACNNFFSHDSSTTGSPFTRIQQAGYSYSTAGENIAAGYASAAQTVAGWMDSAGHRANILNPSFTHFGVGYASAESSSYGSYITAVFASP